LILIEERQQARRGDQGRADGKFARGEKAAAIIPWAHCALQVAEAEELRSAARQGSSRIAGAGHKSVIKEVKTGLR